VGGFGLLERQGAPQPGVARDGIRPDRLGQRDPRLGGAGDDGRRDGPVRRRLAGGGAAAQGKGGLTGRPEEREMDGTTELRDGVDQATVDAVRAMGAYKHGWSTDVEMEF